MKILISHAIEDERPASLLKDLIERCSLKRIEVWFSSDQSASGGIALGVSWFSNLLQRLSETDMIVALITPRSIASPWLYFECGHLANKGKSSIVPLTLGLPVSEIPMPLSAYQGHDLSVSTTVAVFLQKLFAIANVPFDEDMTRALRETTARQLLQASEKARSKPVGIEEIGKNDFEGLRRYLDKRFLELHAVLPAPISPIRNAGALVSTTAPMSSEIKFQVFQSSKKIKEFSIGLGFNSSIQNILDECYFKMDRLVKTYRYLQQWIVIEDGTNRKLLSKGRGDNSAASTFFDPTKLYIIRLLDRPFNPEKDHF
jgi:hypothetical protein